MTDEADEFIRTVMADMMDNAAGRALPREHRIRVADRRDERFALAIDLGTGGLEGRRWSRWPGALAWTTSARSRPTLPGGGADAGRRRVVATLIARAARGGLAAARSRPTQVVAVSCTGQWASTRARSTRDGVPVGPCVLWMDTRGARTPRSAHRRPAAGLLAARALASWVRRTARRAVDQRRRSRSGTCCYLDRERPEIARAARWYLEPVDYLSMRFTGSRGRDARLDDAPPGSPTTATSDRLAYDAGLVRRAGRRRRRSCRRCGRPGSVRGHRAAPRSPRTLGLDRRRRGGHRHSRPALGRRRDRRDRWTARRTCRSAPPSWISCPLPARRPTRSARSRPSRG